MKNKLNFKSALVAISCTVMFGFYGCVTIATTNQIDGNYLRKDGNIGKPNPYFIAVLPFALVFDIATSPVQVIWLGGQL